jgi:hypothetical protein
MREKFETVFIGVARRCRGTNRRLVEGVAIGVDDGAAAAIVARVSAKIA